MTKLNAYCSAATCNASDSTSASSFDLNSMGGPFGVRVEEFAPYTEDTPCTGEPPSLAIVYVASPDGLFVMPVVVIDFYTKGA